MVASNLISGYKLLMEDGRIVYVDEVRIEKIAESIKVYNLEVGELHTYFVAGGVLVHNQCEIDHKAVKEDSEKHIFSNDHIKKLILMIKKQEVMSYGIWGLALKKFIDKN